MIKSAFRSAVFISILGHLTLFSLFSFSFGYKMPVNNFAGVYSLGGILGKYDLIPCLPKQAVALKRDFTAGFQTANPDNAVSGPYLSSQYYLKPQAHLRLSEVKSAFRQDLPAASSFRNRKEQVLTFHPRLPVNFLLFFKDRQAVHIELMFNIMSSEEMNSVVIKRKISSGNLEADLLSMRYIGHYLFLQQARFTPDNWQIVKIDLSPRND